MSAPAPESKRWGARLAIALLGAIGLAVAARTAAFYLDIDRLAFGLSLLIAAGLAAGIVELFGRVVRVERIAAELARLPRPASLEAIDGASEPLRAVLRARLTGVRAAIPSAGFASYLVGLLVMVGLLGTFLGLVEALRGAREALGASSDIDALRTALSTPMLGLSRAFGISAAGLTASAMLGLASVFARRAEASLARAVHGYGDDALGPLTVAERQLAALEALVRQSAEASLAAARATEAIEATAAALRADVAAGVADVARAVEGALTPALERAVARASDVTRERLDEWSQVVEREADARKARDAALAEAWAELAGESADRVAKEGARALGELRGVLGESLASLDGRLGASVDALAGRLGARTEAVTDDLEARLAALTAAVGAMVEGLSGELEGTRARLDRTLEATTGALEAHAERSLARERAREEATDARASALAAAEAEALGRLERHVEAVDAALASHLERMSAMQREASREASERAGALETAVQEHALGLTSRAGAALEEAARQAESAAAAAERVAAAARGEIAAREASEREQAARVEEVLGRLAATGDAIASSAGRVLAEQAERQRELELGQNARAEEMLARLSTAGDAIATSAGRVLAEAAERQRELEAGQAARAEEMLARLSTAGDAIASSAGRVLAEQAERQRELEAGQAARAEEMLAKLSTASDAIASSAGRVLAEQAERQSELEARWLAAHDASAARLVALLEQHAHGLAEGLSATQALVDDAAGLLRASGVEMSAVAEVFTAAVDRYRDASAASLGALAGLDEAVDRAGKKAAIELLTDYLDQTREVFDHSLEVQRELFEELRALRGRSPAEKTRVRAG